MRKDRFQILIDIIAAYLPEDVPVNAITPESDLMGELNINSAHLVDIVLDVEDEFDIRLENEDMEHMKTVGDALRIIGSKLTD